MVSVSCLPLPSCHLGSKFEVLIPHIEIETISFDMYSSITGLSQLYSGYTLCILPEQLYSGALCRALLGVAADLARLLKRYICLTWKRHHLYKPSSALLSKPRAKIESCNVYT
jgi:hypothetical protein